MDLRNEFAIDVIVHIEKMNEKFIELDSSFSKDILQKGKVLLLSRKLAIEWLKASYSDLMLIKNMIFCC